MRTQFDQKTVDQFQTLLAQAEPNRPTRFSLREVIRESWTMIQQARERNVSWDTIVTILQQSIDANGHNVEISATTVRKYFSEFSESAIVGQRHRKPQSKPHKSASTQKKIHKADSRKTEPTSQQPSPVVAVAPQAIAPLPIERILDTPKVGTEILEPTEVPQNSPEVPGWTGSGWVEPAFNRNRARPKQEKNL